MTSPRAAARRRGFSLPELLAALAIAMVLVSVALPGYREHQHAAARVQAQQALQAAERCRVARLALAKPGSPAPWNHCLPPDTAAYRFLLVAGGEERSETYDWRAEPRGAQRQDRCGTLVLDHQGRKGVLGSAEDGLDCWRGR